jgi:Na+/proline symporter
MIVTDIYRPYLHPHASDHECLVLERWLVAALLVGGVAMSYPIKAGFGSVFEAFQTFLSFFQGPLLALLLMGMLTRRATPWGAVAGMFIGVGTSIALTSAEWWLGIENGIPFLWVAWWSFAATLVTVAAVSTFTRPHAPDRLRGLVLLVAGQRKQSSMNLLAILVQQVLPHGLLSSPSSSHRRAGTDAEKPQGSALGRPLAMHRPPPLRSSRLCGALARLRRIPTA